MNKYHNIKTIIGGIKFDSKKEARRYQELKLLFNAGKISFLETHPRFEITVKGKKICTYIADFRYLDESQNKIVEDVKGVKTSIYRLKKKLMKAVYNIEIQEI